MPSLVLTWVANSAAIWLAAYLFRGVTVGSWTDAFVAGLVLTLINAIIKPILVILTLPITLVTLGLFYFVVSAICLKITANLIDGFAVSGWFNTIIAAILISVFSTIIQGLLKSLDQPARAQLRKYGVRFGAFNIYFPQLMKPGPSELALTLWILKHGAASGLDLEALPQPPRPGLTRAAGGRRPAGPVSGRWWLGAGTARSAWWPWWRPRR